MDSNDLPQAVPETRRCTGWWRHRRRWQAQQWTRGPVIKSEHQPSLKWKPRCNITRALAPRGQIPALITSYYTPLRLCGLHNTPQLLRAYTRVPTPARCEQIASHPRWWTVRKFT